MCLITHEGQYRSGLGTTLNVLKWPSHKNDERNPMKFKRPESPLATWRKWLGLSARPLHCMWSVHEWRWSPSGWKQHDEILTIDENLTKLTGTTRHLLLFNNCLSVALHLFHNDLFFFWQQDLRDTLFPHHCTQIKRKLGFKCPSAAEGLPDESRKTRPTCGVLVQAGTRAVSLNHPQYLSIFLQSNCAYHRQKRSLSIFKKSHAASWRVGLKCWF